MILYIYSSFVFFMLYYGVMYLLYMANYVYVAANLQHIKKSDKSQEIEISCYYELIC